MIKLLLIVLLLLLPLRLSAQIAFDAVSSNLCGPCSTLSITHTSTGSNLLLFVGVNSGWLNRTTTTVTYAGAGLTEQWDITKATTLEHNSGHYKTGPATGANTVAITLSGSEDFIRGGAITHTGVDQTTPVGTHGTATGSSGTASVTVTTASGEVVIDNVVADITAITVGADQTSRWEREGADLSSGGSTQPGASGGVMTWTFTSTAWAIGAVPIKPVAGAAEVRRHVIVF